MSERAARRRRYSVDSPLDAMLAQPLCRRIEQKPSAHDIAHVTMRDALPPGSPLPGTITAARFVNKNEVTANVTLFDGLSGVAHFRQWSLGWSYGWDTLEGGDISLEGGEWTRVHITPAGRAALGEKEGTT